jgi:hypothetical protein
MKGDEQVEPCQNKKSGINWYGKKICGGAVLMAGTVLEASELC